MIEVAAAVVATAVVVAEAVLAASRRVGKSEQRPDAT
jgi:hypothetical protein